MALYFGDDGGDASFRGITAVFYGVGVGGGIEVSHSYRDYWVVFLLRGGARWKYPRQAFLP